MDVRSVLSQSAKPSKFPEISQSHQLLQADQTSGVHQSPKQPAFKHKTRVFLADGRYRFKLNGEVYLPPYIYTHPKGGWIDIGGEVDCRGSHANMLGFGSSGVAWRASRSPIYEEPSVTIERLNVTLALDVANTVVKQYYNPDYQSVQINQGLSAEQLKRLSAKPIEALQFKSDIMTAVIQSGYVDQFIEKMEKRRAKALEVIRKEQEFLRKSQGLSDSHYTSGKPMASEIVEGRPSVAVHINRDYGCATLIYNPAIFLFMEKVPGIALAYFTREYLRHYASIEQIISLSLSMVEEFEKLHKNGAVHLDANEGNIIIDLKHAKARLIDFGMAQNCDVSGKAERKEWQFFAEKRSPYMLKRRFADVKSGDNAAVKLEQVEVGVEDDVFALLYNLRRLLRLYAESDTLLASLADYLKAIAVQLDMPEGLMLNKPLVPAIKQVILLTQQFNSLVSDIKISALSLPEVEQRLKAASCLLTEVKSNFGESYLFVYQAEEMQRQVSLQLDKLRPVYESVREKTVKMADKENDASVALNSYNNILENKSIGNTILNPKEFSKILDGFGEIDINSSEVNVAENKSTSLAASPNSSSSANNSASNSGADKSNSRKNTKVGRSAARQKIAMDRLVKGKHVFVNRVPDGFNASAMFQPGVRDASRVGAKKQCRKNHPAVSNAKRP